MAALMPQGKQQYFTAGGIPLVGGKVYTYAAGTTTPLATYTTAAASTPNANPVILDSRGEASIFFSAANYKIVVKDSLDSTIWTQDNLPGDQAATILANLAASTGSSLVGHIASGTGAVATTVRGKLRESVSVKDFGAVGNGSTDDTSAFSAAIAAVSANGQSIYVPAGTYVISSALTSTGHLNMHGDGDKSILDFSAATISTSCITVSGALDRIQNITSASIYGLTVTFASAPSLAVGDIFCVSSTDLWNTVRAYYYAGEWCQVKGVSGSAATVTNPLYDSYNAANVSVYKMSSRSVSFSDLRIVGGANTFGLVKVQFCDKPIFKNASFRNANYQLIEFDRCYRPEVINCVGFNAGTGTLDDYGIVFGNSQKARVIGGDYYSRRHGVVMGGGDYLCAVTNRDIKVIGATISNDILSGVNSADLHGNTQECSYIDCTIYNGAAWAGMDNGYNNCTITNQSNGSVIYSGEVKGGDLYIRNSHLVTAGSPVGNLRGIIDVGGNSSVINTSTDKTLSLIVENCYVKAPSLAADSYFMKVVNTGSAAYVNIYIDKIRADVNVMGSVLRTELASGTAYSQAIVVDGISNFPAGTILHSSTGSAYTNKPHRLMSQSGSLSMTAATGTSLTISSTQSYRYQYPRVPQATVSIGSLTTGFTTVAGQNIGATIFQIREEGIRLALVSTSNANWADTIDKTVNYICQISEV